MNHQRKSIEKADDVLQAAESKLAAFEAGALAAFTEVELWPTQLVHSAQKDLSRTRSTLSLLS